MSGRTTRALGEFGWNTTTGHWDWDAGMYELHGYGDAGPRVTTELVLQHKQVDHRDHAAFLLNASATADRRFTNYHVIVGADGRDRTVLVVGESRTHHAWPGHERRFSRGFMVDVTTDERDSTRRAVALARQSTGPIQQSVGLLSGSLGLTEDSALSVLRRVSGHHNVKVRDLAFRFMDAARASATDSHRDLSAVLVSQARSLAVERTQTGEQVAPTTP